MSAATGEPSRSQATSSIAPADLPTLVTDVLVLFLLIGGAFEFFGHVLGIRNRVAASVLALLWLRGAVAKISELRHGRWLAWRFGSPGQAGMLAMIAVGATPWLMMQALHDATPSWQAWQSAIFPVWARVAGALIAGVAAAMARTTAQRTASTGRLFQNVGPESYLLVAWLLAISSSALVGLLSAGQLIALSLCRLRRGESGQTDHVEATLDSLVAPG